MARHDHIAPDPHAALTNLARQIGLYLRLLAIALGHLHKAGADKLAIHTMAAHAVTAINPGLALHQLRALLRHITHDLGRCLVRRCADVQAHAQIEQAQHHQNHANDDDPANPLGTLHGSIVVVLHEKILSPKTKIGMAPKPPCRVCAALLNLMVAVALRCTLELLR